LAPDKCNQKLLFCYLYFFLVLLYLSLETGKYIKEISS